MQFEHSFFEGETREDFFISPMMKMAWSAILEVLEVLDDLCRSHDIPYFACGGTLLGAIRHKGFIPWDDDLDLCILRDDYMRFLSIAEQELPEGFVLAGPYAKETRLWDAAKTFQSRIIADETVYGFPACMDRFHGFPYPRIGLDLFPYDFISDTDPSQKDRLSDLYFVHFLIDNWDNYKKAKQLRSQLSRAEKTFDIDLSGKNDPEIQQALMLAANRRVDYLPREKADGVANLLYGPNTAEMTEEAYQSWLRALPPVLWYQGQVRLPFECTTVPVSTEYEKVVVNTFGPDYMTPVKFAGDHEYPFYKNQEAELKRIFKSEGIDTPIETFCVNWHNLKGGV